MAGSEPIVLLATSRADRSWPTGSGWRLQTIAFEADHPSLASCSAIIIDGEREPSAALAFCQAIARASREHYPRILFLGGADDRIQAFSHGADVCLTGASDEEFLAQVATLIRRQDQWMRISKKADEADQFSRRLQQAYDQINLDLDMAGRLQTSFLPKELPEVGRVRFAVHYRPNGPVGGDFYDVFRLDERTVGFYVADVMGHGVPASLLTIYLKKAVVTKEITPIGYRIVPPDEVLKRLNRDLLAQQIAEQPFATMIYGIIDVQTGKLTVSRAAHPYPFVVPVRGAAEPWKLTGTLLGVFEFEFESHTRILAPGEKLLLTTDGVMADPLEPQNTEMVDAIASVRAKPVKEFIESLATRLLDDRKLTDDATLLALEFQV